jgi:hypothetical protein
MSRSKEMKATYRDAKVGTLQRHKALLADMPRGKRQRLGKKLNNAIRLQESKPCR